MSSLRAQNLSDKAKLILWKLKGIILSRVPKKCQEERQENKANKANSDEIRILKSWRNKTIASKQFIYHMVKKRKKYTVVFLHKWSDGKVRYILF